MLRVPRRTIGAATIGAVALALVATSVAPAHADDHLNLPGEPTITLPINDSEAGGTYDQDFTRVYANTTPDGTPVYIYVPEGTPLDGSAPTGVASLDPAFDPTPATSSCRAPTATSTDYTLTQAQIDYMGDQLANQIVAVDEEHFGPMDAADPDRAGERLARHGRLQRAGRELLRLRGDDLHRGVLRTRLHRLVGHERRSSSTRSTGRTGSGRPTPNGTTTTPSNDQPTLYEGVIAHELEHLLHNYSDPGELSWVDEGLADFAVFLNGYDVGGSHLTYHQVFYADTSLTRWGGGLQNYGAAYTFFQYLWEQAGGNGDGTYDARPAVRRRRRRPADQADLREPGRRHGRRAGAIDAFNAQTGAGLRSAEELFQDWAVAVYLDDEASARFDIKAVDFGDPAFTSWTIDIADDLFWEGRGSQPGRPASVEVAEARQRAERRWRCRSACRSSGSATPDRT